jgi:hypothetical protein
MRIVGEVAAAYADAGYFTIVEGIVIPRWFLAPLREALEARGHEVAYAVLRTPLATSVARREAIQAEVVEGVWRQFEDLGELEAHAIDASTSTPGEVADELAEGLGGRFLLSP